MHIMSENGQTHFKNLAAFAARFLNYSDHFGTLCIKGLKAICTRMELVNENLVIDLIENQKLSYE